MAQEYPRGLFGHQLLATELLLEGNHVCITTPTASGKSLPFFIGGIESIARGGRVLAIYPLKALARQQEERWRSSIQAAGLPATVGRIDGDIPSGERSHVVRDASVLVATPDILHAWLLPQMADANVRTFLSELRLMVVDEVHQYTGVFGSNAAFVFRRLQHASRLLGNPSVRHLCTSATIADPAKHMQLLFGEEFVIVGPEHDTSRRHPVTIQLIEPPHGTDLIRAITTLLSHLSKQHDERFIAFLDSRRQTELVTAILERDRWRRSDDEGPSEIYRSPNHLEAMEILPFRAGYEEDDRTHILERLYNGQLKGIVSTSALELGLDIAHLTTGVLIGVPRSSTSLWQRIGRIGRNRPGRVLIVNTRDVHSARMFRQPDAILQAPPVEGALYLENRRIQYIHALCLAREGDGEHDVLCSHLGQAGHARRYSEFDSPIDWPTGFIELCRAERAGEIPPDLHSIKIEAGDTPQLQFPLRANEVQFDVLLSSGPYQRQLGQVSFAQVMREAYPGAVYYYAAQPYRVHTVSTTARRILVRSEKHYTTNPIRLPTQIYPHLLPESVLHAVTFGPAVLVESGLQVREVIVGIKERRGSIEETRHYPMKEFYQRNNFSRNYFTTGVVLSHPAFDEMRVEGEKIAELLYEGLLSVVPFERQDLSWGHGRSRVERGPIKKGYPFIAVFDQTYGSLRLSSRLMEKDVMIQAVNEAWLMATVEEDSVRPETIAALESILEDVHKDWLPIHFDEEVAVAAEDPYVQILLPGSKGWVVTNSNFECEIEGVVFTSKGLMYRGRYVDPGPDGEPVTCSWPSDTVVPVPGESRTGFYHLYTGEIVEAPEAPARRLHGRSI